MKIFGLVSWGRCGSLGYAYSCQLPNGFAPFSATIDKSWFKGLDVEKLQKEFPDRIQIHDPNVHFKGPAFFSRGDHGPIVTFMKYSDPFFRKSFQIAVGIASFALVYYSTLEVTVTIHNVSFNRLAAASRIVIAVVAGIFAAFVAGKIFDDIMR